MTLLTDPFTRPQSVLDAASVWRYQFDVTLHLDMVTGGIPSDPKVAKGWLATRLGGQEMRDQLLMQKVHEVMEERHANNEDITSEEALNEAVETAAINVNGFKRTPDGVLYLEGRCIKAMLKECASIGTGSGIFKQNQGANKKKGAQSFVAEHVQVLEDKVPFYRSGEPVTGYDEIEQHFVHTKRGSAISYTEMLYGVDLSFTITTDYEMDKMLRTILLIGEQNGLGARRSQGSGRFIVTRFEQR